MYLAGPGRAARGRPAFREGLLLRPARHVLPPYDTRETLRALRDAVARFGPRDGDRARRQLSRHRRTRAAGDEERATLDEVQTGREWIWVTGNHDRILPDSIGGEVVDEMALGSLTLRHEPVAGRAAGDRGPSASGRQGRDARARRSGGAASSPMASRCVMPAFGAYAGGLNACDAGVQAAFPERLHGPSHRHRAHLRDRAADALPGLSGRNLNRVGRSRWRASRRTAPARLSRHHRAGPVARDLADLLLEAGLDQLEVRLGPGQDDRVGEAA